MIKEKDVSCTCCNVMDIGTVIRESDSIVRMAIQGDDGEELKTKLTELARKIESEPCKITTEAGTNGNEEIIFHFSCAAEKLIFEMRTRHLV